MLFPRSLVPTTVNSIMRLLVRTLATRSYYDHILPRIIAKSLHERAA